MRPAGKTPLLPLAFKGDAGARGVQLPEVPEEEVADLAVGQGPVQQEFGQLAVEVGLILEHLYQLQKILENLVVPAENKGGWDPKLRGSGQGSAAGEGAGQGRESGFPLQTPQRRFSPHLVPAARQLGQSQPPKGQEPG